jgi:hypothetical protein
MIYTYYDFRPFRFLLRYGFKHKFVNHSKKEREYARRDVHTGKNSCERWSNLCKLWIGKFMGVNKKNNLETYSKSFQWINQSMMEGTPREERLMRILSYYAAAETLPY